MHQDLSIYQELAYSVIFFQDLLQHPYIKASRKNEN